MLLKWKHCRKVEKDGDKFIKTQEPQTLQKTDSTYRKIQNNAFYRLMVSSYKEISSLQKDSGVNRAEIVPHVENALKITLSEKLSCSKEGCHSLQHRKHRTLIGLFGTFGA
jgi:hypothetical protein